MTRLLVVTLCFLLGACRALELPEAPETLPQLIYQSPLPPWPGSSPVREISLDLKIYVNSDGTVREALLVAPTRFRDWNAQALREVRTWRFSPAIARGQPIALWIRQTVRVHFEEPNYVTLAECVCIDQSYADSVYTLLKSGEVFVSLASRFSVSKTRLSGGRLGDVDVRTFPSHIRSVVAKLRVGEFTLPLKLGQHYVIYKRIPSVVQGER